MRCLSSPNIIKVIILKGMGLKGHVAHMSEMRNAHNILVENLRQTHQLEDLRVNVKLKIKLILPRQDFELFAGFKWLKIEPTETSGLIK
jgi:hypothetical protein